MRRLDIQCCSRQHTRYFYIRARHHCSMVLMEAYYWESHHYYSENIFFFEIRENSTNESNDRSIRMAPATMYSQLRTIFSYFVHEIQGLHFQLNSLKGQRKKCCSNQNIKSNDIFMTDNWFWNAKQLHTYMRSLWKKKKQISSIFFHSHSQFIGLLCGRTRHTDPTFLIVSHIIGSFRNWMNI